MKRISKLVITHSHSISVKNNLDSGEKDPSIDDSYHEKDADSYKTSQEEKVTIKKKPFQEEMEFHPIVLFSSCRKAIRLSVSLINIYYH